MTIDPKDVGAMLPYVAIIGASLAIIVVLGPSFLYRCRALFPRRPRYVLKARAHNAARIAQTSPAHGDDALRRAQFETVTRLNGRQRLH